MSFQTVVQQAPGVLEVRLHHVLTIPFGRDRARTLMENGLYIVTKRFAADDAAQEIVLIQIVNQIAIGEIEYFSPVGQVIDHQNISDTGTVQVPDNIAADKAGAAGYQDHVSVYWALQYGHFAAPSDSNDKYTFG